MYLKAPKRTLAFLLALILVLSTFVSVAVIPASAAEADVADTGDVNESYSLLNNVVSVDVSYEASASQYEGSSGNDWCQIKAIGPAYTGGFSVQTSCVITITNNSTTHRVMFNYSVLEKTLDTGIGEGDGSWVADPFTDDNGRYVITPKGSIELYIYPDYYNADWFEPDYSGAWGVLRLSDFKEVVDGTATVSGDDNAAIVANGTTIDDEDDIEYTAENGLTLQATPDNGYGFLAWVDAETGEELSSENPATLYFDEDEVSVAPVLYETDAVEGYYGVKIPGYTNEAVFDTLEKALEYQDGTDGRVITVLKDVNYDEDVEIPAKTTLLIPFDAAHTVYTDTPEIINSHTTPSAYVTFNMTEGSALTVLNGGAISVGGQLSATGQLNGWNGAPTGPDGRICMEDDSLIEVQNGGSLYAWGYIHRKAAGNEGSVLVENGATVYEPFQIKNYRGGTVTTSIFQDSFPFNQYYVQNVEVPMQVEAGASEICVGAVTAGGITASCGVTFIGEGGLFYMEDGYLIKDYIEAEDRLKIEIFGDSQLSSMSVSMMGMTLDTSAYPLPITNNVTVELAEGDLTVNQDLSLLPGTELIIDQGASMTIDEGKSVYVYDADQWNGQGYVGGASANFIPVGYSVANGTTSVRGSSTSNLADAKVDINGDVEVRGGFYCTDKANVSSSEETGTITYASTSSTSSSIEECQNNSQDTTTVNFGAAQLRKSDGTYASPVDPDNAANYVVGEYAYSQDTLTFIAEYIVTWYDYNGETLYYAPFKTGENPVYKGALPTMEDTERYLYGPFSGWSTTQFDDEAEVASGATFPAVENEDVSYYAVFPVTEKKYNVTWKDNNGNVIYSQNGLFEDEIDPDACTDYPEMASVSYSGTYVSGSVARDFTNNNTNYPEYYKKAIRTAQVFDSWEPEYDYDDVNNIGTCTFTAHYVPQKQYLVFFLTEDKNSVLDAQYITEKTSFNPCEVYAGVTPTKDSDDPAYEYVFTGWKDVNDTNVFPLSGDNTYEVLDPTSQKARANKDTYVPTFDYVEKTGKHSLSLNGEIDVNFYADLPAGYDASNTTADFSWGDKFITSQQYDTETPNTVSGVSGANVSIDDTAFTEFSLPVSLKEINDDVTVTYKSGGETVATETFKPTDYLYKLYTMTDAQLAPYLKGSQTAAQLRELIRTMLISAADAQTSFNYNTDQLATYRFTELGISDALTEVDTTQLHELYPADDDFDDVTFYGSALNLEAETGYTMYFNINDPSSFSIDKYNDVKATTTDVKGNAKNLKIDEEFGIRQLSGGKKLRIKLDGFAAAEITNDISFTYKGTTITVNPGEYIALALDKGSASLQNTVTALYNYNQAAIAFFGGNNG